MYTGGKEISLSHKTVHPWVKEYNEHNEKSFVCSRKVRLQIQKKSLVHDVAYIARGGVNDFKPHQKIEVIYSFIVMNFLL